MSFDQIVFLNKAKSMYKVYNSLASAYLQELFQMRDVNLNSLFVLRFYGPINPMGSCRPRSVYLTTLLLGRLSPLSG